jgi:S-formylglutathione hydrolase
MPRPGKSKFLLLVLCLLYFVPTTFAQQTATAPAKGRVLELTIPAPSLKGNLLNDPVQQPIVVYLPPSYDTTTSKRFATLYLLHGFTADQKAWTGGGYQGLSLGPFMDEMIKSGRSRELIVVAPNGKNTYGGAFYMNSAVNGNWEDYILRDVIGYVDANYRTLARAESRGVAGHSMGGFGAITLGMKHPEVFSAVYALSPCCLAFEGEFGPENPAWPATFKLTSMDQLAAPPKSFADFFVRAIVALSSAFSPNPNRPPFYVDFPFQERDGKLEKNDAIYAKWVANFPVNMVEANKQNLRKLRGIYFDVGEKEQFPHIPIGVRQLSKALGERNIPHSFEVYADGDHGSLIRQRMETRVLEFFSERLDFGDGK